MLKATVRKSFSFAAAHSLTGEKLKSSHPCRNVHGHTWTLIVEAHGEVDPLTGFVIDYRKLSDVVEPLVGALDHALLNDRFSNPTSEFVAQWFFKEIDSCLPEGLLSAVELSESPKTLCRITRNDL